MRPARRREAVDRIRATWRVSIRRACSVLQAERSSYHYKGKRRPQAVLNKRIKEIAETRVRYGYRRIHVLLRREGWRVNAKRVWRLYREMGLQLRSKTPKRRVKAKLREGRADASAANEVWAMDFVHDQLFDGRKIRVLTIIDTFTRLSPRSMYARAIAARMWWRRSNAQRSKRAYRRRSASTTAQSLSARSLIYGLSSAASRLSSRVPASRLTTPSFSRSTASSVQSA
jgi:transposase InsO family protein